MGCRQTRLTSPALAPLLCVPGKCGPLWASVSPLHTIPEGLRVKPQNLWTAAAWEHLRSTRHIVLSPCMALKVSNPFSHCDFSPSCGGCAAPGLVAGHSESGCSRDHLKFDDVWLVTFLKQSCD